MPKFPTLVITEVDKGSIRDVCLSLKLIRDGEFKRKASEMFPFEIMTREIPLKVYVKSK